MFWSSKFWFISLEQKINKIKITWPILKSNPNKQGAFSALKWTSSVYIVIELRKCVMGVLNLQSSIITTNECVPNILFQTKNEILGRNCSVCPILFLRLLFHYIFYITVIVIYFSIINTLSGTYYFLKLNYNKVIVKYYKIIIYKFKTNYNSIPMYRTTVWISYMVFLNRLKWI